MAADLFFTTFGNPAYMRSDLLLDGTPFHTVDSGDVAPGYAEVDVTLDDNGTMFNCLMVAGNIGTRVSSSGDAALSGSGEDDTVSPFAGWWIFTKKDPDAEARDLQEDPTLASDSSALNLDGGGVDWLN
jgi:hypothetical protein